MHFSKKKISLTLAITLVLSVTLGLSYGAAKNEIKAIQGIMSFISNQKTESLGVLTYKGETYAPIKKIAGLLNKKIVVDASKNKVQWSDASIAQVKPIAIMTLKTGETIEMELYPEAAPATVENFVKLAKAGFYNGLTFHRIIDGFMIQGGDPLGTGTGGPGYKIKGEFMKNGFSNPILHEKGVVSMARAADPNSAGSQFFIMLAAHNSLNGDYAAFGKVIKGFDVVEKIGKTETDDKDKPKSPQVIQTIVIK